MSRWSQAISVIVLWLPFDAELVTITLGGGVSILLTLLRKMNPPVCTLMSPPLQTCRSHCLSGSQPAFTASVEVPGCIPVGAAWACGLYHTMRYVELGPDGGDRR